MAVLVAYGPPGAGKSYFGVQWAMRAKRKGRKVYSTFPIDGCRGLLTLAHAWCDEFSGSDFIVDEAGSMFNSRDFKDLDPLVFGALTHSRHQDVNVLFLCQHPMYLETNFRRVAETFIKIGRFGASGERARNRTKPRGPLTWMQEPIAFVYAHYKRSNFTESDYSLKQGARPKKIEWHRFRPELANRYDSFNHVPPPSLRPLIKDLKASAYACANVPVFEFRNGKHQAVAIPDLSSLSFPVRDSDVAAELQAAREAEKLKLVKAEVKEAARVEMLASMGYLSPEEHKFRATITYPAVSRVLPLTKPPAARRGPLAGGGRRGSDRDPAVFEHPDRWVVPSSWQPQSDTIDDDPLFDTRERSAT